MKTILLVDDNENFQYLIKEFLERSKKNQYKFIVAANPMIGLDQYYKHKDVIDLVLCDYFMPVQNGSDLLEIIKQQNPNIPCLLVSGDTQIKKEKFSSVDESFSKFELDEIVNYVQKQLSNY